ncbi:hypothetical protein V2J09_011231 [Rumex salicifolius]
MILTDSTMAVRFCSSSAIAYHRPCRIPGDIGAINVNFPRNKDNQLRRKFENSSTRRCSVPKNRTQATGKYLGSGSDQVGENEKEGYHPFEDISDSEGVEPGDARLTAAETSRTVIEVNSKATLMFTGLANDELQQNIFWPDLPYLTDEHGNIYFQVNNDEDMMQTLTSENNYVQVIIGLDTTEMMSEMEISGPATIDFGIEEIEDEDSDFDDDDDDEDDDDEDDDLEGDWVDLLEDEDAQGDSDGSPGDWAKLETMRSSHPMYFATRIAEVSSDDPIDFMEQPPAGLALQGLLRPAFIEEQSVIQKHRPSHQINNSNVSKSGSTADEVQDHGSINGHKNEAAPSEENSVQAENLEIENCSANGPAFYRLEMIKIELLSANGHQLVVEIEDYKKAQPDAIAHSAAKVIDRVKAAGEKTVSAFKSLCWRCKGLQVEEASLIGIDSLGFDLRVCSGTQVQTLRFAFSSRATSEYSAERQLNDLLFPRSNQRPQIVKASPPK